MGGGGGEYVPQMGFGWTNGVALTLLKDTGSAISAGTDDDDEMSMTLKILVLFVLCISVGALIVVGYYMIRHFRKGDLNRSDNNDNDRENGSDISINILHHDENHVKRSLI